MFDSIKPIKDHILYRDAMMLVLNKPAGIAVHQGTKQNNILTPWLEELKFRLPSTPELVHRLDTATSGCLVLGRHRQALKKLNVLFANNKVEKTYWAVVKGTMPQQEGQINLPIGKQSTFSHTWWMKVDLKGKEAITNYRVLGTDGSISWIELKPLTGRTHQLRVHCAALTDGILGDQAYAKVIDKSVPLHLHAYSIRLPLYDKKPPIFVSAPPPAHMLQNLYKCGYL